MANETPSTSEFDHTIPEVLSQHRHPGEFLTCLGEAWLNCSCDERISLPVRDDKVSHEEAARLFEAHQTAALAPLLADLLASARADVLREHADREMAHEGATMAVERLLAHAEEHDAHLRVRGGEDHG